MLNINAEPHIFEIWRHWGSGEIHGSRRQDFQTEQVARFMNVYRFNSSIGAWIIVTDCDDITNGDAIEFARMIFEKRYRTIHVDTTICNK